MEDCCTADTLGNNLLFCSAPLHCGTPMALRGKESMLVTRLQCCQGRQSSHHQFRCRRYLCRWPHASGESLSSARNLEEAWSLVIAILWFFPLGWDWATSQSFPSCATLFYRFFSPIWGRNLHLTLGICQLGLPFVLFSPDSMYPLLIYATKKDHKNCRW